MLLVRSVTLAWTR